MSPAGGKESPRDWDHSGIGLDRYASTVLQFGCIPTLFVSGEAARAHAPMLLELQDRGAEIGLFVAPNQSLDSKKGTHMGKLSAAHQRDAINRAGDLFTHYLGFKAKLLRTGLYSANSDTYTIAAELHFTHVAFRMPGAALPVIGTEWPAEGTLRVQQGLCDVPVTTDPSEKLFNRFPLYLAPEVSTPETHLRLISQAKQHGIVCMSGGTNADYWDRQGTSIAALEKVLAAVNSDHTLSPVGMSTLQLP